MWGGDKTKLDQLAPRLYNDKIGDLVARFFDTISKSLHSWGVKFNLADPWQPQNGVHSNYSIYQNPYGQSSHIWRITTRVRNIFWIDVSGFSIPFWSTADYDDLSSIPGTYTFSARSTQLNSTAYKMNKGDTRSGSRNAVWYTCDELRENLAAEGCFVSCTTRRTGQTRACQVGMVTLRNRTIFASTSNASNK